LAAKDGVAAMSFKDLFSPQAPDYARYRPSYPPELFAWLAAQAPGRRMSVDVGTGSGQAAVALAQQFERVIAVDPSEKQLASAVPSEKVEYMLGAAEATGVDAGSADLLTAAQCFHWFDREKFFAEVRRVVRPGGCLAIWCYGLSKVTPEIDAAVYELYEGFLGPYWEPERKLVEEGYRSVAFPFEELAAPPFEMRASWTLEQLAGYLGTWSPLKKYREEREEDPLQIVMPRLERAWGAPKERAIQWPLSVRAFRL
jgi:SAM-dependent methyltransferase